MEFFNMVMEEIRRRHEKYFNALTKKQKKSYIKWFNKTRPKHVNCRCVTIEVNNADKVPE